MTNNQKIAATRGTEYTFNYTAKVICSFIGGPIYSFTSSEGVAVHYFTYKFSGMASGHCAYVRCNNVPKSAPCYTVTVNPSGFNPPGCPEYIYITWLTVNPGIGPIGCFEYSVATATKCLPDI